jgi:hypothetical protein
VTTPTPSVSYAVMAASRSETPSNSTARVTN